jgi:hypothetical protein
MNFFSILNEHQMKTYLGIWIDSEKAYFVELEDGRQYVFRVDSSVEDFRVRGGSRSKVPYGPQDNVSESKFLERRKHQFHQFMQDVIRHIAKAAAIYIVGPAETRLKLEKEIRKDPAFDDISITNEAADSMTTPQLTALVRKHFDVPHSWAEHAS